MKRPEGFDPRPAEPAAAPRRPVRPTRGSAPAPSRTEPAAPSAPEAPRAPRAEPPAAATPPTPASAPADPALPDAAPTARPPRTADRPARRLRLPRIPHPSRTRPARSEFATAERHRKREERSEIRRFTRRTRRRRLTWLISGGLVGAMLLIVVAAVFSPLLALRHIQIDGTERLDAAALQDAVDGQLGTPLALLDQGRLERDLGAFRLIRSYTTELIPPDTLLIHIVERAPIGVVPATGADGGFDVVDAAGIVVETVADRPDGIPLIELPAGEETSGDAFRAMAEVLLAVPDSVQGQVDSVTAATRDDVTFTLAGSGQRVVWGGPEDPDLKAQKLAQLIAIYAGSGPGEYDVSAPRIAIWRPDGA